MNIPSRERSSSFAGVSNAKLIWGIALLAILVRLLTWYFFRELPASEDWAQFYSPAAAALAQNRSLPPSNYAMSVSPLYVIFLALVYRLMGDGLWAMRLSQSLLDGLNVWGIFVLGGSIYSPRVGWIGALAYAVYPVSIYMAGLGQPEWLLTLCITGGAFVWLRARRTNSFRDYVALGGLLGAALLLKPNYYLFFPFWVIFEMLFPNTSRKQSLIFLSIVGVMIYGLRAGWSLLYLSPDPPASLGFLRILFVGTISRPSSPDGSLLPLGIFYQSSMQQAAALLGTDWNSPVGILQATLSNWIQKLFPNPLIFLSFALEKFLQMWYVTDSGVLDRYLRWLQFPVAIFSYGGMLILLRDDALRALAFPLLLLFIYSLAALLAITPLVRELTPVAPIIMLFAAVPVARIFEWQKARRALA